MAYTRRDFKKLRWNVYDLAEGSSVKFTEYRLNEAFSQNIGVDKALLVKWIVYMYDINSPIAKIEDVKKRSMTAAIAAGFPYLNKKFPSEYKAVITMDDDVRVRLGEMIIEYCKLQRGSEYSQLAVYENLRMQNNNKLLDPELDPSDIIKYLDAQNKVTISITELRNKFFIGEETNEMYEELLNYIEADNLEFSPEQIAFSKSIRESILNNSPYGKWKHRAFLESDLTDTEKKRLKDELENETAEAKSHFEALGIKE